MSPLLCAQEHRSVGSARDEVGVDGLLVRETSCKSMLRIVVIEIESSTDGGDYKG